MYKIEIFNELGSLVRNLIVDANSDDRTYIQWNGLDDNGSPVPTGVYICRITARAESRSFSAERKMVMAK